MSQSASLYPLSSIEQAEYRGRMLADARASQLSPQFAPQLTPQLLSLGIKSINNPTADPTSSSQHSLDITDEFNGRYLAEHSSWSQIYVRLKRFLDDKAKQTSALKLTMDAHISLAFAAGWVLNLKDRWRVYFEQYVPGKGAQIWHAQDAPGLAGDNWPVWDMSYQDFGQRTGKFVVGISLAKGRNVEEDVRHNLAQQTGIQGLLLARLQIAPGQQEGVICGQHADSLAIVLEQRLRELSLGLTPHFHFFIAAPNAFSFFLGQRMASLGESILYEFDFEKRQGGGYMQSLSLAY